MRDRSSSLILAALCAVVGCTALIEGEVEPSPAGPPIAHGSRSSVPSAAGMPSSGGEASVEPGGSGGVSDPSAAGVGGEAVAAGGGAGAAALAEGGVAGEHVENGGNGSAGAEQAVEGDGTGGERASGGTSSGGSGGSAGTSSGGSGGSAGTSGGPNGDVITWKGPLPVGDRVRGHLLVIADRCGSCHAEDLGGRGFYRNITPDVETGIGGWTDRQIANAIRGGGGPGTQFCSLMPLYSGLKDQQIADMVAYLRSVPAISNKIASMCPGHYPPGAR